MDHDFLVRIVQCVQHLAEVALFMQGAGRANHDALSAVDAARGVQVRHRKRCRCGSLIRGR
ncbi:MAG: hypothetical protein MZV64_50265 [Ignavibacteriales bacterium]|nr:hypothetical protein [Ignavibacteriales bacterium]